MIVFCEECGARNIIDPEQVQASGQPPRCKVCKDALRFSLSAPAPYEAASAPASPGLMELEVRAGDQVFSVGPTRPTVTMGRQEHNDIEVIDTRVSRSHARIEFRDGKFIVIDHSTNGTFVLINGKQGVNLKNSETILEGMGIISLGRKAPPDSAKAIHFQLK